ncbi:MAG: hypothetical protein OXB88_09855 [Bacteriovoracales bacterium]|nr:hypothetical protein [Bacteriovoracales bacterium]
MQKKVNDILAKLIDQLIPKRIPKGELNKICKATGLSASTLRMVRSRQTLSADTLIKLLLAHGASAETIGNLPRLRPSKICESLTLWNKIGLNLGSRERIVLGRFIKTMTSEWKLK